jgi:hypothetical protein
MMFDGQQARQSLRIGVALMSIVVGLLVSEAAARLLGYTPSMPGTGAVEPSVAFDPVLGWINSPGTTHKWPMGLATFWHDASRRTRRTERISTRDTVLVLGCSYTQGYLVGDEDTFAWKLQQRFPLFDFRNFGTSGYGTYQSLLRFRRFVAEGRVPALVIFGFAEFHGPRDRATRSWIESLRVSGSRSFLVPPHVDWTNGRTVERPGRFVSSTSALAQSSAAWNLVETWYARHAEYAPDDRRTLDLHRAVLLQLRREVEQAGSRLLLADLWTGSSSRASWRQFFWDHSFTVAECAADALPFKHPDPFWHLRHADCIERAIRQSGLLE